MWIESYWLLYTRHTQYSNDTQTHGYYDEMEKKSTEQTTETEITTTTTKTDESTNRMYGIERHNCFSG